jgi:hypothetical protein
MRAGFPETIIIDGTSSMTTAPDAPVALSTDPTCRISASEVAIPVPQL